MPSDYLIQDVQLFTPNRESGLTSDLKRELQTATEESRMEINVTALDMFDMLYVLRGRLWDARIEDVQRHVEEVQKTGRPVHVRDYTGSVVAVFEVDPGCSRISVRGI